MEEQTKSTKTMKIVLFVVIGLVVVVGIMSALFYTPNGECIDESVQIVNGESFADNIPADDATVPNEEAAPF